METRLTTEPLNIGFIGLGTMGAFMAANLQKAQHRLVVNDARKAAAESHIGAGAEWADTPRAVAEQCDLVFTSLPGPLEVEAVVLGQGGLLEGAHPGMAYFDLSTNSQALMRRVHAAMAERGAQAFDAPVSGGPMGAETGKLESNAVGSSSESDDAQDHQLERDRVRATSVRLREGSRGLLGEIRTECVLQRRQSDEPAVCGVAPKHSGCLQRAWRPDYDSRL